MDVLVPIDDSDPAQAAVEHAVTSYPDADICVLHVINPVISAYGGNYLANFERAVEVGEEKAEELFDTAQNIGDEHGVSITTETLIGPPARTIVHFSEEADTDHIVLGSHGRSGVSRVLLGSVAEQVVRRAPVPVTVVR